MNHEDYPMLMDGIKLTSTSELREESGEIYVCSTVYDISGRALATPKDGATIAKITAVRPFILPQNLPGSIATCDVAPASNVSYSIRKNGVQIGTMDFLAGQTTGTFNLGLDITFEQGDKFRVVTPATADPNHNIITFTIVSHLTRS
jgi:hypothetical protein